MLTEHWDAAEADFQQFYGLDLEAELETAGARRLAVLTLQLPGESRLAAANSTESEKRPEQVKTISLSELGGWIGKRGG